MATSRTTRRRAALALALSALLLSACGDDGGRRLVQQDPPPIVPSAAPTTAAPAPSRPPSVAPPASPLPSTASPTRVGALRRGDSGSEVLAWQRRLVANGFWLGRVDGTFGSLTQQATWAVEKAAGLRRDGIVGPAELRAVESARQGLRARTTSGRAIEIDLQRQLLLVVRDGRILAVLNTSTGSGRTYVDAGRTQRAVTPRGTFTVYRQIDGLRRSPLGVLWRPKYFNGGIAVHGAPEIPPWPASHGCVRLSNAAMDWIWASGHMPLGTRVLVH